MDISDLRFLLPIAGPVVFFMFKELWDQSRGPENRKASDSHISHTEKGLLELNNSARASNPGVDQPQIVTSNNRSAQERPTQSDRPIPQLYKPTEARVFDKVVLDEHIVPEESTHTSTLDNDHKEIITKPEGSHLKKKQPNLERSPPMCPRHGKPMIIRPRRKDGAPFYACTEFPSCGEMISVRKTRQQYPHIFIDWRASVLQAIKRHTNRHGSTTFWPEDLMREELRRHSPTLPGILNILWELRDDGYLEFLNKDGTYRLIDTYNSTPVPAVVGGRRYWWVNQNQTYNLEISGGYMWSPKVNRNGARNQFYENMTRTNPGDVIFSFKDTLIKAIGVVTSRAETAMKPPAFHVIDQAWSQEGWLVRATFTELDKPIRPKDHMNYLGPTLPNKYSPLQQDGNGIQSVYLAQLPALMANVLIALLDGQVEDIVMTDFDKDTIRNTDALGFQTEMGFSAPLPTRIKPDRVAEVYQDKTGLKQTLRAQATSLASTPTTVPGKPISVGQTLNDPKLDDGTITVTDVPEAGLITVRNVQGKTFQVPRRAYEAIVESPPTPSPWHAKLGQALDHPKLGKVIVTDVSDLALLTIRNAVGSTMQVGRGTFNRDPISTPSVAPDSHKSKGPEGRNEISRFKENRSPKGAVELARQILEYELKWLSLQEIWVHLRERGWNGRESSAQISLNAENGKSNRRIRRVNTGVMYRYGLPEWHITE